jgi:O-antigen/teichoic acid export membrane protein
MSLRKLAKDTVVYGASTSIHHVLVLGLLPFKTRWLTVEDVGILEMLVIAMSTLTLLGSINLHSATIRYYYDHDAADRRRFLRTVATVLALGSVAVVVLAISVGQAGFDRFAGSSDHSKALWWMLLTVPARVLFEHCAVVMRLRGSPRGYLVGVTGRTSLMFVAALWLLIGRDWGVRSFFVAEAVTYALGAGALFWSMRSDYAGGFMIKAAKRTLRFSLPGLPAAVSHMALLSMNRFFLAALVGDAAVGLYSVCARLGYVVSFVGITFRLAWDPYAMSIKENPDAAKIYARLFRYLLFLFCLLAVSVTVFGYEVVILLGSERYLPSVPIVGLVMLVSIFPGINEMLGLGLLLSERTYLLTVGTTVGLVANVAAAFYLIPMWGIAGAALTALAGVGATSVALYIAAQRSYRIPYDLGRALLAAGSIACLSVIAWQWSMFHDGSTEMLLKRIAVGAVALGIATVGLVTREDAGIAERVVAELIGRLRRDQSGAE